MHPVALTHAATVDRRAGKVMPSSAQVLRTVQRFGVETTSFQVLEPGMSFWSDGGEGLIAFVDTGAAWVTAGAPLCTPARLVSLTSGFVAAARAEGRRVCFCAVEAPFLQATRLEQVGIGAQPVWDPVLWPEVLAGHRSLREQLRRARAKHVTVRRLLTAEVAEGTHTRAALEVLTSAWLSAKRAPPLRFLLDVDLFRFAEERQIWIAEREGTPVALLSAVPIYGRGGWFFEDVIRSPAAPNGTAELLIDGAMKACAQQGCRHVTFGLVPLTGALPRWLRVARRLGKPFYDFDGLLRFREKLRPHRWEPVCIGFPTTQSGFASAWDVITSVTGHPLHYLLRAVIGRRSCPRRPELPH